MYASKSILRFLGLMALLGAGMLAILASGGCSSKPDAEEDKAAQNLLAIGNAYAEAWIKLGRPPKNANELKPHLTSTDPDVFRSPDDGEMYVIHWGTDPRPEPEDEMNPPVLGYEKTGVGGRRVVLVGTTRVQRMTDEELAQAKFPKGFKPPK